MAVAVTAVAAAIEVTTVASVLSAVAAVGLATTVVGIATGKPNMIKIGGELGLIGGIGGLVNGAVQSLGTAAIDAGGAGVAEGAAPGAYSDVAGEKFAQSVGQDAAGSGFAAASDAAGSLTPAAGTALGASSGSAGALDSVVMPKTPGILDLTQTQAQAAAPASFSGQPLSMGGADLSGTSIGTDAGGMYTGTPTPLADAATGNVASGMPSGVADISDLAQTYGTDQGTFDQIKSKIGAAWNSLSPQGKAEVVKSALAIPGGIQAQKNFEAQNAINQQKVNQSSYGSAVPTFGIIARAQKG